MASFITPRVNATYLDEFKTKNVRIVGQVTQVHGDNVVIDANGQVQLNLSPAVGELKVGQFCEIIGTVQNDLSIHVSGVQDFGDNVGEFTSTFVIITIIVVICFRYFFLFLVCIFCPLFHVSESGHHQERQIPYQSYCSISLKLACANCKLLFFSTPFRSGSVQFAGEILKQVSRSFLRS